MIFYIDLANDITITGIIAFMAIQLLKIIKG